MRNLLNKKLKNEKGLTLIELLAVIVILAIIALIAIPAIGNIISNSKSKAILSDATTIIAGSKTAIADGACTVNSKTKTTCTATQLQDYVEGVTLASGDQVVKENGAYEITYEELKKVNDKYAKLLNNSTTDTTKKNTSTQADIAEAMGNKPEEPEKTN
ncbi:prepilin-type N-terminal cleavage/methylation domain-containing protein [Kurthia gibsonii]|uniref:prepilin-type N-terminal cleavage/methylation domain-containing protein n=1 Tax=Kurthia gibsonii TaxID=33946 RepID=UPI002DB72B09|nr:prepilin-type N-terminal cleavage/methylation domain-containing protein [Kurthia gibsonii]MEB7771522.1 prepilin-type N-terminal cleavage/methylation domain-containing protein [Kurthia gibsonii]